MLGWVNTKSKEKRETRRGNCVGEGLRIKRAGNDAGAPGTGVVRKLRTQAKANNQQPDEEEKKEGFRGSCRKQGREVAVLRRD